MITLPRNNSSKVQSRGMEVCQKPNYFPPREHLCNRSCSNKHTPRERFSESTFGFGISEIFEFRSIGNLRILEHFWHIFGNLGISVHSVFLVDAKFCFCKNNKRIIIIIIKSTTDMVQIRIISVSKNFEPPPKLGTDGPELEFPACGARAHTHKHPRTEMPVVGSHATCANALPSGSPPSPSSLCDL